MGTWVQSVISSNQVSQNPTSASITVSQGSTIIVFVSCSTSDARTVSSVTDGTNTYQVASAKQSNAGNAAAGYLYYAYNVTAGTYTITVHMNASATFTVVATEVSGATTTDPRDQNAGNNLGAGSNTTMTVGAVTTTQDAELLLGFAYGTAAGRHFQAIAGWTNRLADQSSTTDMYVWTKAQSSQGSQSIVMTTPSNQFMYGFLLTLKDAATSGLERLVGQGGILGPSFIARGGALAGKGV